MDINIKTITMIKKILFVASIFVAGFASAQSFQLMDHNDVDISGTTHYEYGTPSDLGNTKFHIQNLTNGLKSFALKVEKIHVPYNNSGLSCCFGQACFSASATVSGTQIINNGSGDNIISNGIYTELKVSPITWPWVDCAIDSAVWTVTVYDPSNPSDESTATIIWRCGNAPTSVDEINASNVKLSAYPNPTSNNLTIQYSVDGNYDNIAVDLYDVLGQKLISQSLNNRGGKTNLDVSALNAGVYFYAIKVDGQTIRTERLIVE